MPSDASMPDHWPAIATSAAALVAPAMIAYCAVRGALTEGAAQAALAGLAVAAVGAALTLAPAAALALAPPSLLTPVLAAALAAAFVLIWGPLLGRLAPGLFDAGLARLAGLPQRRLTAAVLIGAAVEEALYRLVGFGLLANATGAPLAAGAASVTAFALAHVPIWGWRASLSFVVPGVVMTLAYAATGDVLALVLAHAATDAIGLLRSRNSGTPPEREGGEHRQG